MRSSRNSSSFTSNHQEHQVIWCEHTCRTITAINPLQSGHKVQHHIWRKSRIQGIMFHPQCWKVTKYIFSSTVQKCNFEVGLIYSSIFIYRYFILPLHYNSEVFQAVYRPWKCEFVHIHDPYLHFYNTRHTWSDYIYLGWGEKRVHCMRQPFYIWKPETT